MMITGDGDLVDLLVSVRYRVKEPRVFLFEVGAPEEVLRTSAESVLRGLVAGRPFLDLLTVQRRAFQDEVHRRLQERCERYTPAGLGIVLEGVSIVDLHPPADVVEVYDEVARAMEQRDRLINEAQERAIKILRDADAEQKKILSRARADRVEKIQLAEADRVRFLAYQRPRDALSIAQEFDLLRDALREVLRDQPVNEVHERWQRRRQELRQRQAVLTDFRLYWDGLARALTGRDLLLIDADPSQVRGRRNLMLFDPDQLRLPVPLLMPESGLPLRSQRPGGEPQEGP
jgi:regulator of protease activity HflC (stomatin/prohibitin superfamily)